MNKVYLHEKLSPDNYLGHVNGEGKVLSSRFGPDKYIGRFDITKGKIFESRFGPDKYVGRVKLDNGKIYRRKFGPDEYLGRVNEDGECYKHKSYATDTYIGKVTDMTSFGHAGAGFFLLLLPAFENVTADGQSGGTLQDSPDEEQSR